METKLSTMTGIRLGLFTRFVVLDNSTGTAKSTDDGQNDYTNPKHALWECD